MTETCVAEVADGTYQLMTYLEEMDFAVNQYLLTGEEPLLFHTGMRGIFPLVADAVARVVPVDSLRWISFGHVEADECGSLNDWLAAAPEATVVQGATGCMVSIGDMAARAPRPLAPGEKLDIGSHCVEWIDTPHVPHAWEAGVLYDHTTKTLLCGGPVQPQRRLRPDDHRRHRRPGQRCRRRLRINVASPRQRFAHQRARGSRHFGPRAHARPSVHR